MRNGRKGKWKLFREIDSEIFKQQEGKTTNEAKWYIADLRQSDGPVGTQVMRFHVGLKRVTPDCFVRCGDVGSFQRVRDLKFGIDHFHHLGQDLGTFMDMLRDRYDDDDDDDDDDDGDEGGDDYDDYDDDDSGDIGGDVLVFQKKGNGGNEVKSSQVCIVS